jgi:hypothetical protein
MKTLIQSELEASEQEPRARKFYDMGLRNLNRKNLSPNAPLVHYVSAKLGNFVFDDARD